VGRGEDTAVEAVAEAIARVGGEVIRRSLTWGTSGNLSARLGDSFVISPHWARLDDLRRDRLVVCPIDAVGEPCPGASVEFEMHRAVYAAVPDARAVLHTSAPYTTVLACSRIRVPFNVNTDSLVYVGPIARVPFRHPGTIDLARAVAARATRSRALLLDNHGSLVWDTGLDDVLRRTEALEFLARLLVTARAARIPLSLLSDEDVAPYLSRHLAGGLESPAAGKRFHG